MRVSATRCPARIIGPFGVLAEAVQPPRRSRGSATAVCKLVGTMPYFLFSRVRFMTADQPDKFLRMHLTAMRARSILLRHRALGAAVVDHLLLFRRNRYPAHA